MLAGYQVKQSRDITHGLEFTALVTRACRGPADFGIKNIPAFMVEVAGHHSSAGLPPIERIDEGLSDVIEPQHSAQHEDACQ